MTEPAIQLTWSGRKGRRMAPRQHPDPTCAPLLVLAVFLLAVPGGCRNSGLDVVPVTGSVSYQGKPVEGATVTFLTGEGRVAQGELAYGTTDAQGRFELRSQAGPTEPLPGAVPGEHRVTISKLVPPGNMTEAVYRQKLEEEKRAGENAVYGAAREVLPPPTELLPAKYSQPQQTTLTASVKKGEKNDFPFELQ